MTLDKQRKKELASAYQNSFRPMGVYQIRNVKNGKILVDGTMDLDGAKNRLEFMKQTKLNNIPELKQDWEQYGGDCFVFEELDRVKPREESVADRSELKKYRDEVGALLELWIEKLQPFGDAGYNKLKRKP
ncbi:GIY-YIG nuclease family protein [Paenibacillus dendritiformis]|uniref:GIY-YIG nuclease family protein n=1 Tax=Paenibacillus dendritiformis TaxID=130049 RepID=UPI00143D5DC1|nr:GIY-YIG nuclease family protein [Paenibacillus dendritiformis]NKI19754.1 GIY-YIG nuclease family protein [Paenibacillus dendritiformis]NRF99802.1 GIY-YIG nuclease family protein [Paenibacillus dendritiformis]